MACAAAVPAGCDFVRSRGNSPPRTLAQRIGKDEYRSMARNTRPLSHAVRRGDFLHDALIRLLR